MQPVVDRIKEMVVTQREDTSLDRSFIDSSKLLPWGVRVQWIFTVVFQNSHKILVFMKHLLNVKC